MRPDQAAHPRDGEGAAVVVQPAASSPDAIAPQWPFEVVIVTYRSRHQVEQLLAQLHPEQPLVVVDNSADADGISALIAARPNARYLVGEGKGFGRAANLGATTSTYDYLVFCNPDSRPQPALLSELVRVLVEDHAYVSCAALPVDEKGRAHLGAVGWEPSLRRAAVHAFGLYRLWPTSGLVARPVPHEPIDADWLTGACIAVRREPFLDMGGFDESYFVYSEDVQLGRAIRSRGLRQVMRTDLLVPHVGGGSGAPSLEMNRLKGASMARYLKRHNTAVEARAMRVLLVIGYVLRIVERLLHADLATAKAHAAYVKGISTGRATVAGVEVTRA